MTRGNRLGRSASRVGRHVLAAAFVVLACGWVAAPGIAHASDRHLEIDVSEQVLLEVVDGQVVDAIHISTGSGKGYWLDGAWWDGETPRGSFEIYAKDPGWVEGSLGSLYNAMYFYEGFAVHGSYSVPDYPASHGCVRVSIEDANALYARIPIGTPVFVHD